MHRQNLLKQLEQYQQKNPTETTTLQKMISFINTYPTCFERSHPTGHITGSAWILNHNGTQALLMHHAKLKKWLQLGGHADGESDILQVALREAQEESGFLDIKPLSYHIFDIDIHDIPAHKNEPPHLHYDIRYLFQMKHENTSLQKNQESLELKWFTADDIGAWADESIKRLREKWKQLSAHPEEAR